MSSDTKWIIGTIVPTILLVGGMLSVQSAVRNVRTRGWSTQVASPNTRINDVHNRLDWVDTDVSSLDARLRAVEVGFGKLSQRLDAIDQRLDTLERAILPSATPSD